MSNDPAYLDLQERLYRAEEALDDALTTIDDLRSMTPQTADDYLKTIESLKAQLDTATAANAKLTSELADARPPCDCGETAGVRWNGDSRGLRYYSCPKCWEAVVNELNYLKEQESDTQFVNGLRPL
jgi:hypothetical protein